MRAELIAVAMKEAARCSFSVLFSLLIVSQTGIADLARAATTCDTANYDGFFLGADGKTTYAVTKEALPWQDAQTQAQTSGGRLAVITDQPQNDALAQGLGGFFTPAPPPSSGSKAWIGLSDPLNTAAWCMEGEPCVPMPQRFTWADGFSGFRNYSSGEPNGFCTDAERSLDPDHNCYGEPWVAMGADGKWSDEGNHGPTPITLRGIVEWPQQTLDCVKVTTPPLEPPVLPVPDADAGAQWCTNSQQNSLIQCLDTTDGGKLCPFEQAACQVTCPAGYAYDNSSLQCEAAPVCPAGSSFNGATGRCEAGLSNTTGYAVPVTGRTEIMKYKARGDTNSAITAFSPSSAGMLDALSFDFALEEGEVVLKAECAWGGDGNCGCASPHWNGWCRSGTDITQTRSGTTLTVTATIYDWASRECCPSGYTLQQPGGDTADYCLSDTPVTGTCLDENNNPYPCDQTPQTAPVDCPYKVFTTGAACSADLSEFVQCPSGYVLSDPPTQEQCQQILTLWGNQTGLTDCTQASQYSCTATVTACPSGYRRSGDICYQVPTCPGGGTIQGGKCVVQAPPADCPTDPTLPCQSIQGDSSGNSYCSPNPCQTTTEGWTSTNDTETGTNDKTNDGPRAADGTCLGTIYLFNGNDMRCRLYDRWGMVNSYAKLAAQIVLSATGAGAALAAAMGVTGAMATAVIDAAVQIATNVTLDAATGQLDTATLIQAGVSLMAAGISGYMTPEAPSMYEYNPYGSTTISITDNGFVTTMNDSLSSLANPFQLTSYGQSVLSQTQYQQFMSQVADISEQYSPAINQGMLGNYSETRCCHPDTLSAGCEQSEIKEASLAGNGACHVIGTYCASKLLFTCMVSKQTSCCFSSRLGRIIHEQGRGQLTNFGESGGWGDVRSPNCRGFTPTEFQSLDFSAMDLSEFTADITGRMEQLSPLLQDYMDTVGQQTEGLLQASPNLPQEAQ